MTHSEAKEKMRELLAALWEDHEGVPRIREHDSLSPPPEEMKVETAVRGLNQMAATGSDKTSAKMVKDTAGAVTIYTHR